MPLARRRQRLYWLAAIVAVVSIWIGIDLFGSVASDLREFDPEAVARLETDMWRSYYDRRQVRLFLELAETLRVQYRVPLIRSNVMAFRGAKAAFIFKDGQSRTDYERALPDLVKYYEWILGSSSTSFDANEAARLELEWWIIHRERDSHPREVLDRSLAELQSALYRMPIEGFLEHGRLRAEAMLLRDAQSVSPEGVTETDWIVIHDLLSRSWLDLWNRVHQ